MANSVYGVDEAGAGTVSACVVDGLDDSLLTASTRLAMASQSSGVCPAERLVP